METDVRLMHLLNAIFPILFTLLGITTEVRLLHSEKVYSSIDDIPLDKVIVVRPLHPVKAYLPILFTLLGIIIEDKLLQ